MTRKTNDSRPKIWADGRQHPKLDPKSFALASVGFAREGMAGLLERCAASALSAAGTEGAPVAEGRFAQLARLTGEVLDQSARWVGGKDRPQPDTIFAPVEDTRPSPRPADAPAHSVPLDPDLALLRSVISDVRAGEPKPAQMTKAERTAAALDRATAPEATANANQTWRRDFPGRVAGAVLGFGLLVVSVPYGAIRAVLAHLDGQDLRRDA